MQSSEYDFFEMISSYSVKFPMLAASPVIPTQSSPYCSALHCTAQLTVVFSVTYPDTGAALSAVGTGTVQTAHCTLYGTMYTVFYYA